MSSVKNPMNLGNALLLNKDIDNADINSIRLFYHYKNLALNRYRWNNLPNGLESRHIEEALFSNGEGYFYKHPVYGYTFFASSPIGLNHLGDPTALTLTWVGGTDNVTLKSTKGVRILENDSARPPVLHLLHYVNLMSVTEQTIFMNLKQQKFPFIIPTSDENELTVKNVKAKFDDCVDAVFADKNLADKLQNGEGMKVIQTGVPFLLDKLQDFKHDYEAELFTYLGLNNANTDKKERMIVDEVNVNNGQILMSLDLGFKCRQRACDKINELFGLNITVEKVIDELNAQFLEEEGNTDVGFNARSKSDDND